MVDINDFFVRLNVWIVMKTACTLGLQIGGLWIALFDGVIC